MLEKREELQIAFTESLCKFYLDYNYAEMEHCNLSFGSLWYIFDAVLFASLWFFSEYFPFNFILVFRHELFNNIIANREK